MERAEFLKKCKECAMMCSEGMQGMKVDVPAEMQVEFNGLMYYPKAYELSFNMDGSVKHMAVIHDLKVNSVIYVPLKDIR